MSHSDSQHCLYQVSEKLGQRNSDLDLLGIPQSPPGGLSEENYSYFKTKTTLAFPALFLYLHSVSRRYKMVSQRAKAKTDSESRYL